MAVSILVYSVCNSLIASEEGRVSGVQSGVVNIFCMKVVKVVNGKGKGKYVFIE